MVGVIARFYPCVGYAAASPRPKRRQGARTVLAFIPRIVFHRSPRCAAIHHPCDHVRNTNCDPCRLYEPRWPKRRL
jgi:hypothetical protein